MSCCGGNVGSEQVCSSAGDIRARHDEEAMRHASRQLEDGLLQTDFLVPSMHCAGCISALEKSVTRLPWVRRARANLSNRRLAVVWDGEAGKATEIAAAITGAGYENTVFEGGEDASSRLAAEGRRLLLAMAVAGFASANIMLLSVSVWSGADAETARLFHLISGLIAVPAVAISGRPFFDSAIRALSAGRLNMDVPISLGVLLATGMSFYESLTGGHQAYFEAATMLIFFLLIGRYLDQMMRQKARGAVDRLSRIASRGAMLVDADGLTRFIPVNEIEKGMHLRVLPGERLPVDGVVTAGRSDVDRSLVTGESDSRYTGPGEQLEAGVLNLTGPIDIEATTNSANSFLSEILRMMEAAENGRGRYVRLAERVSALYSPVIHLLALATFAGWMVATGGDWHRSIYTAIALLIITCPCALGLAVPVVHVIGANRLFRNGVLIRDGSAFERLAEIDRVAFDKTGTLTTGEPEVTATTGASPTGSDGNDAGLIAALAGRSSHPAARALLRVHPDALPDALEDVTEVPGFGMEARWNGRLVRLGRPSWVGELAPEGQGVVQASMALGVSGGGVRGFVLRENLRRGAVETAKTLRDAGLELEILSGDGPAAVARVAGELGIASHSSELKPQEKIERVSRLQEAGHRVLVVGDGLNDAPALAAGHVSMAPASASDVGRLASDFVFTRPDLGAVSETWAIARRTGELVRQNFGLAIVYNAIAVPIAIAGYVTPLIAAVAMSASSIIVVANSMRLDWRAIFAGSGNVRQQGARAVAQGVAAGNLGKAGRT